MNVTSRKTVRKKASDKEKNGEEIKVEMLRIEIEKAAS